VSARTPAAGLRALVAVASLAIDVGAAWAAYFLVLAMWAAAQGRDVSLSLQPGWSLPVLVVILVGTYFAMGLYKLEAYVSRPLHLWTIFKATIE